MAAQHRQGPMHSCSLPLPGMSYLTETKRPTQQTNRKEREDIPVFGSVHPNTVAVRFQNCCSDLRQNALAFEKFALLTGAHKDSTHRRLQCTRVLARINDFTPFVRLAGEAGGERRSLEQRGRRGGSKRRDTDVFCRCLLNFYESPGRTLTNQS